MPERIYLSPPNVGVAELQSIHKTIASGWVAPSGPTLEEFEAKISSRFDYPNVLVLNSGTSALHLAIKLAGITKRDRVIVGTLTFAAAANVVLYEGGIPVFVDSEPGSWGLSPELLRDYLRSSHSPMIKAVILTHIYGKPANVEAIYDICREYGIVVIEDAAEATGTRIGGRFVGSFGDFGVLSFNGNKLVTTGGGGALLSGSSEKIAHARKLSEQAKEAVPYYLHKEVGYNYRLSSPLAAIGIAQLDKVDEFIAKKKEIKLRYQTELNPDFFEFPELVDGENHWLSIAFLKKRTPFSPSSLVQSMEEENIESRQLWNPLHNQPVFEGCETILNGVSDDLFSRGLCLPCGTGLTEIQQTGIIDTLNSIAAKHIRR